MSAPSPSASSNPSSARAVVDGYSSENERSRSPLPIIHRVSNSPVVPAESSLPFFTYEPSVSDIENLLMTPLELHQAYESLTEARENEGAFSPLFEEDSLDLLFEEDSVDILLEENSVDLLLEGDNVELRQSILGGVRELYTFDREMPVTNIALLSFNAADSGEGRSSSASALKNMQQVAGLLPLQLDCPLLTNQLDQVTRNAPSSSGAVLASELSLPSDFVCSAAPSFESASASALVSASRSRLTLSKIKSVDLVFKEALKKDGTIYLIFNITTERFPSISHLGVRLLSLKMGDHTFFTETTTVYKGFRKLIVLIPEDQCFISNHCLFEMLCFSYSHGKIYNPCYKLKSTFALANNDIRCVSWEPVHSSGICNERGRIKNFLP